MTEADLAAGRVTPQFIALLEYEFERREAYYRHAAIGVRNLKTGRWGVMAGLEVYGASTLRSAATATTFSPAAPRRRVGRR